MIDSNLLIRLEDGDETARRVLEQLAEADIVVPYQSAVEFACGMTRPDQALAAVARAFRLEAPHSGTLEEAARRAAAVRKAGKRVGMGDAWIAASAALRQDYVISSNKRHFTQLGVPCWNYMREGRPPQ